MTWELAGWLFVFCAWLTSCGVCIGIGWRLCVLERRRQEARLPEVAQLYTYDYLMSIAAREVKRERESRQWIDGVLTRQRYSAN